ncbi:FAD-dependent monooxygenase [Actinacidiphila sp. ITFR-21]|uniref:FAD-dependent monooxygenase n=1 Tax=Actinacidiphila sp. ITFR-21 TaxID=3075199 RepID=UPI00288A743C|nr:FAD-dependent monooxygenase [Streptomyces sp. ITFR-21]WNI18746.1 FAD-dependent monooxygenase [Streptomyces sp. ITFR-21]
MQVPVLVVGAGPVGLALAGDLGWRGVNTLLVERTDGAVTQPKMDMVGIRSMEFCRRWGITDWVESAGYNRHYTQDCAWVTDLNGYEFGREPFPAPADEKPPPHSPQHRERCPQNFFDPVLTRFAVENGSDIRYNTELVDFTDLGDRVVAVVRDADGTTSEIECQYLIGTDGGGSRVRDKLGIEMTGDGVLTYTTNAVFRCDGLESLHHTKAAYRYIFIGEEGTWATLVAINGKDQWRFSLIGDGDRRLVSEEEMRTAIVRAVGREFDFEILSMLPWVRRQLVADHYRSGRVFLAGDSAHLTSPTGGFGMNTGLLDAVNLSWKLAAVLDGWGGETLLDSYETEQRPVAIRNVTEAGDNLKRMLQPRVAKPEAAVFAGDSAEATQARKEYGQRYTEMMAREWFTIGIHLGYLYEGSPVIVPDGTPAPELTVSTYTPTARPGSRAPHVWLSPQRSTLDEFGLRFALLRFDAAADAGPLLAAAQAGSVPIRLVDVDSAEAAALYEKPLVLVRPDGQVAWRGDDAADAAAIVETVCGLRGTDRTSETAVK